MDFNKLERSIVEPVLFSFGFVLKDETEGGLEYGHTELDITIAYDYKVSYEVDVMFLFKYNNTCYVFRELKEYLYGLPPNLTAATQITDEAVMIQWLESVKAFFEEKLAYILENIVQVGTDLKHKKEQENEVYAQERDNRQLQVEIEKLWSDKDYAGLVKLLEKHSDSLEGSTRKKYEYAISRTGKR
jgi:hypothetical protein